MANKTIIKQNISKIIVDDLVKAIGQGEYIVGSKIPTEPELMESYGVGRSSVREAMQALSIMGIVDIRPGQGTFVREISFNTLFNSNILIPIYDKAVTYQLVEARTAIETLMAELAVERATEQDIEEIEKLLDTCQKDFEIGEPSYELSVEFHFLIAKASKNIVFEKFINSIMGLLAARGQKIEINREFVKWELKSHKEIFEKIKNRDKNGIRELVEKHIVESAKQYVDM